MRRRFSIALSLLTVVPILGALMFASFSLWLSLLALGQALVALWLALASEGAG